MKNINETTLKTKAYLGGINSYFGWVGGKKASREIITKRIPHNIKQYIEVFTGAGWVFFYKQRRNHIEILNDYNGHLTNLHMCVRDDVERVIKCLEYSLNSAEMFKENQKKLVQGDRLCNYERAAMFLEIIKYSYSGNAKTPAKVPCDITNSFNPMRFANQRLKNVAIINESFVTVIPKYNFADTFFYLDPPYYKTESFYQNIGKEGFVEQNHIILRDLLLKTNARFILSYNDCEFIKDIYSSPKFYKEMYERPHNLRLRHEKGAKFGEMLISNYDTREFSLEKEMKQLTLI